MATVENDAPGSPGIPPKWTSSAKSGIGTSLGLNSRVWFTLSHGILNEIYYPRVDHACVRDLGFIVTNGSDFFSEEKRNATSMVKTVADGIPAFHVSNTCQQGRYQIEKDILADPHRDVLLQRVCFTPLQGVASTYKLFVLLAPHLNNRGNDNTAWVGDYKGTPMLFAQRNDTAIALACSVPWIHQSVGYVGPSDSWNDLKENRRLTKEYTRAENGNVALLGEIDLDAGKGCFVLSLGFGSDAAEAGHRALASLQASFESAREEYVREWQTWQNSVMPMEKVLPDERDLYRTSAAILRTHMAPNFPGASIASLSIPWGFAKGDDDLGGYHLVWPRDLVEAGGALLAAGATSETLQILHYLHTTQEADGHWSQNMWIDGSLYWSGIQMDETALPILLVDMARREGILNDVELHHLWPMIRRAAGFLVCHGPVTQQDRWEEDPGYSPFTVAVEIAALLAAAEFFDIMGESSAAVYLRETADNWNDSIERWMYVQGSELAQRIGVEGYYVRVAPADESDASSPMHGFVSIKNRPPSSDGGAADSIVSPDALALVRFGLRSAKDPKIRNTVKVIDALLRVETPNGSAWHRYNNDGYGEGEDGSPFNGCGIGCAWPLLTGERAHFELARGRRDLSLALLFSFESFANDGGLLPEQIWDRADIPERELFFGQPSGSAMPLVWAHAEYVKLRRSLRDGQVFDTPPLVVQRYQNSSSPSPFVVWRFNQKSWHVITGKNLRIEVLAPSIVHWSIDKWETSNDASTRDTGVGVWIADLPSNTMKPGTTIAFTFFWTEAQHWEDTNFAVLVESDNGKITEQTSPK